jgi:hypothetical protein
MLPVEAVTQPEIGAALEFVPDPPVRLLKPFFFHRERILSYLCLAYFIIGCFFAQDVLSKERFFGMMRKNQEAQHMDLYGISVPMTNHPKLDPGFIPMGLFNRAFLQTATKPVGIALERADGQIARVDTRIHGTAEYAAADRYYLDRLVKTLLWMKGGFRVYVSGDRAMFEHLKAAYADKGSRDFDFHFMANVYERPFEVVYADELPAEKDAPQAIGGHLEGCRIGFDAGGSDRKVSAVIDAYCTTDLDVSYTFRLRSLKSITVGCTVYNLLNHEYESNGSCGINFRKDTNGNVVPFSNNAKYFYSWATFSAQAPIHALAHVSLNF